jgi:hypothetical protein
VMGIDGGTGGGTKPPGLDFPRDFGGCSDPVGVIVCLSDASSKPGSPPGFFVSYWQRPPAPFWSGLAGTARNSGHSFNDQSGEAILDAARFLARQCRFSCGSAAPIPAPWRPSVPTQSSQSGQHRFRIVAIVGASTTILQPRYTPFSLTLDAAGLG